MNKRIGLSAAVLTLAVALAACGPAMPIRAAGSYANDSEITADVEKALRQDPALRVLGIQVATYQNVVQLSGTVDRSQMVGLATRVAHDVSGVASVQNNLIVN